MSKTFAQQQPRPNTILVMAGGTGGHVFPALAVARKLQQRGWQVEWLGTRRGIEAQVVEREKIPITYIKVSGLRGKGLVPRLLAPFKLVSALVQSMSTVRRVKPACVLGMGGFASGPGGIAAWLMRKPLLIHEQNAIAGLTNRMLFRFARRVLTAFPNAFATSAAKVQCVGNPIREAIEHLDNPAHRMEQRQGPLRVLVLGGSLGAQVLNQIVPQALALLSVTQRPEIWHQTGVKHCDVTREKYQQASMVARVDPFIANMDAAYDWADLIICRAGALTIAEVSCVGLASILVPYPYAVDDHQTENARFLERAGAAVIVPQPQFTAQYLADLLISQFDTRGKVVAMAEKAYAVAQRDAAERVADYCMEVCHA